MHPVESLTQLYISVLFFNPNNYISVLYETVPFHLTVRAGYLVIFSFHKTKYFLEKRRFTLKEHERYHLTFHMILFVCVCVDGDVQALTEKMFPSNYYVKPFTFLICN